MHSLAVASFQLLRNHVPSHRALHHHSRVAAVEKYRLAAHTLYIKCAVVVADIGVFGDERNVTEV